MKPRKFPDISSREAVSFIEVLVSLVILSIVLMSFFAAFIHCINNSYTAEETLKAVYMAQNTMEQFYTMDYHQALHKNGEFQLIDNRFHIITTVNSYGSITGYLRVKVQVYINNILEAQIETIIFRGQD